MDRTSNDEKACAQHLQDAKRSTGNDEKIAPANRAHEQNHHSNRRESNIPMTARHILISYSDDETGFAQLLGGRLARIVDHVRLPAAIWKGDIVRLTHIRKGSEELPQIEQVIWRQYRLVSSFWFQREAPPDLLIFLLRSVGADCYTDELEENQEKGQLEVAHQEWLDVAKLAEAIDFPLEVRCLGRVLAEEIQA